MESGNTRERPVSLDEVIRYPIGRFAAQVSYTPEDVDRGIRRILAGPELLRAAVEGLGNAELDTPYREGGWTVRQVVHHVPDSALNGYVRMKLALTEDRPTIKPYAEARWADLPDARGPIDPSLALFETLCRRWGTLLRALDVRDLARRYHHPESGEDIPLDRAIALYAWHGEHHVAHIRALRQRGGR